MCKITKMQKVSTAEQGQTITTQLVYQSPILNRLGDVRDVTLGFPGSKDDGSESEL